MWTRFINCIGQLAKYGCLLGFAWRETQENKKGRKKERQMWKKKGKYRQRMRESIKIKINNGRMKERWLILTATVSICCRCTKQHCSHQLRTTKARPDLIVVWNTSLGAYSRTARLNVTCAWLTNESHPFLENSDYTFHKDVGSIINLWAGENSGELGCQLLEGGGVLGWRRDCCLYNFQHLCILNDRVHFEGIGTYENISVSFGTGS